MRLNGGAGSPLGPLQITVAICTRNRARLLERAVGSVLPQLDAHTEVLIVDNASSDHTVAVATRLAEGCAAVRFEREPVVGLAAARHKALRSARGQWVVFLDDDAVAEPGWLTAYLTFFRALPSDRVAAVGGAVSPEYEVIPPAWYSPTANRLDLGPQPVRVSARHGPWGCNIGYRREVALGAGGFDPALGRRDCVMGAHEETELNLRLERAGYEVWWLPQAHIRHRVGKERLRFGWCLRAAFQSGYTKAVVRRQARGTGTAWTLWRLGRLLGTPCTLVEFGSGGLDLAMAKGPAGCGRLDPRSRSRRVRLATTAAHAQGSGPSQRRHRRSSAHCYRSWRMPVS